MSRVVCLLSTLLIVNGCAMFEDKPTESYRKAELQLLRNITNWSFEGRLALVDEKQSISASISWRHLEDRDDIELVGPLAQGRVAISVLKDKVIVDDGDKLQEFNGDVDVIITEQIGVSIPVHAFRFWVLGINDLQQDISLLDDGFIQGGWLIRYKEMQRIKTELLPKKITVEKDKTKIKLIVDQWDIS